MLATSGDDGIIRFWDIDTTQIVSTSCRFSTPIKNLAFDDDGQTLLAADAQALRAFEWEQFCELGRAPAALAANSADVTATVDLRIEQNNALQMIVDTSAGATRLLLQSTSLSVGDSRQQTRHNDIFNYKQKLIANFCTPIIIVADDFCVCVVVIGNN